MCKTLGHMLDKQNHIYINLKFVVFTSNGVAIQKKSMRRFFCGSVYKGCDEGTESLKVNHSITLKI